MYYFSKHELIADGDGYSVRLYLDQSRHEFASDFFGRAHADKNKGGGSLDTAARRYVKNKLPGVGIRTAYILFGALLIATIPLTDSAAQQVPDPAPPASVSAPADPEPSTPAAPVETAPPAAGADVYNDLLVIVNKTRHIPSDFVPANLTVPNVAFRGSADVRQMRSDAAAALEQMFADAKKDNISLYGVSAYRSYDRQVSVFAASVKSHGSEAAANQYSARPGESEHQTGLAIDITGSTSGAGLSEGFGSTKEGKWVKDNAWKYGFIIRYPKGKEDVTGYQYEPWHIRYVGQEAAREITERGITLEEYEGAA